MNNKSYWVESTPKTNYHEVSKDIIETYYDQSIFVGIFILKEKYQNTIDFIDFISKFSKLSQDS